MTVSARLSGLLSQPPSDPAGRDEWLAEVEAEVAAAVTSGLRSIIVGAYEAFLDSLTAAGDLSAFDPVPALWARYVTVDLGDVWAGLYAGGSLSAWVQASAKSPIPEGVASSWAAVVNDAAVDYQRQAFNRIVGAGDSLWREVRDETANAIASGMTNEQLKDRLQDVTGYTEFRADTIGRTETIAAYNGGDLDGARALGEFGPVEKVWLAAIDARTRETHADADGQVRPLDEPFEVGGVLMDRPHDPHAPPDETVNCRCVVELLFEGDRRPDGSTVSVD